MKNLSIPTSGFRHPASRAALTLAEVLIAMGILTIGLLGVASVFPVGGFYMQSGDIADQGGAIAQAALEDAIIRGHLDPENWIVHHLEWETVTPPRRPRFQSFISGRSRQGIVTNQYPGLRADLGRVYPDAIFGQNGYNNRNRYLATVHGGAYAIDPYGFAGVLNDANETSQPVRNPLDSAAVRRFPAFAGPSATTSPQWATWQVQSQGAFWPVRRVTIVDSPWYNMANGSNEFLWPYSVSRQLATSDDDLALTLPSDGDIPARQRWESWSTTSNVAPSSRQSAGDYSWLITVAPGSSPEKDTFAIQADAHPVEVSTVVFHKREPTRGFESTLEAERLVTARVVSVGPGGGELLLQRRPAGTATGNTAVYRNEPSTSPFEDLRNGQYVMVVAPHPTSTFDTPRLALRWCRVLSIQDEGRPRLVNGTEVQLGEDRSGSVPTERVLVALRGADWPWQPAADLTNDSALSNDLRVAILPGVVAVHTKTMRLEAGSEWSID